MKPLQQYPWVENTCTAANCCMNAKDTAPLHLKKKSCCEKFKKKGRRCKKCPGKDLA